MVCRDAYTRAINYWAGSPDFKGGNKLQLSVDYLSAYPLLPLHYPCSLLFYYKGFCSRCVEVCDTYLIVLPVNCSVVKFRGYGHAHRIQRIGTTDKNQKFH